MSSGECPLGVSSRGVSVFWGVLQGVLLGVLQGVILGFLQSVLQAVIVGHR